MKSQQAHSSFCFFLLKIKGTIYFLAFAIFIYQNSYLDKKKEIYDEQESASTILRVKTFYFSFSAVKYNTNFLKTIYR